MSNIFNDQLQELFDAVQFTPEQARQFQALLKGLPLDPEIEQVLLDAQEQIAGIEAAATEDMGVYGQQPLYEPFYQDVMNQVETTRNEVQSQLNAIRTRYQPRS
jgi:hypothetical protein